MSNEKTVNDDLRAKALKTIEQWIVEEEKRLNKRNRDEIEDDKKAKSDDVFTPGENEGS